MKFVVLTAGLACLCVGLVASANGWTFIDWLLAGAGGFMTALALEMER